MASAVVEVTYIGYLDMTVRESQDIKEAQRSENIDCTERMGLERLTCEWAVTVRNYCGALGSGWVSG